MLNVTRLKIAFWSLCSTRSSNSSLVSFLYFIFFYHFSAFSVVSVLHPHCVIDSFFLKISHHRCSFIHTFFSHFDHSIMISTRHDYEKYLISMFAFRLCTLNAINHLHSSNLFAAMWMKLTAYLCIHNVHLLTEFGIIHRRSFERKKKNNRRHDTSTWWEIRENLFFRAQITDFISRKQKNCQELKNRCII